MSTETTHKVEERWFVERLFTGSVEWKAVASRATEGGGMEVLTSRRQNNPNATYRLVKRVRLVTESRGVLDA